VENCLSSFEGQELVSDRNGSTGGVAGVRRNVPRPFRPDTPLPRPEPALNEVVAGADYPALIIEIPGERIVSASATARALLAPDGNDLIGHALSEYLPAESAEMSWLLATDRLNGYQSERPAITGMPGRRVQLWVRAIEGQPDRRLFLVLLSDAGEVPGWAASTFGVGADTVIGAMDEQLRVDRVSADIQPVLSHPPEDVLGQSLLQLISPADVSAVLFALAQSVSSRAGVSVRVRIRQPGGRALACQLVMVPMSPLPSCAFSLQPALDSAIRAHTTVEFGNILRRLGQGILAAGTARYLSESKPARSHPLSELTTRETEIVTRLLAGDRVPAIAAQLYLAQSTIRNHLSTVFSKLGVRSQQELIVLLRQAQSPSAED
jgi:DNA-binding CsgD family transcriptional regulator